MNLLFVRISFVFILFYFISYEDKFHDLFSRTNKSENLKKFVVVESIDEITKKIFIFMIIVF